MYNLHLTGEQIEIRDTIREFATREIKPIVLKADRLDACDRTLPLELLDHASQMGMRTLALSEELGGAGVDALTCCIVAEELAAADADLAAVLMQSAKLAHLLFDRAMSPEQRDRFLPEFLGDDGYQLAFAKREPGIDTRLGVNYHRPVDTQPALLTTAVKSGNGDWIVNGVKDCVANAPIAGLFAVVAKIPDCAGASVLMVPANAAGMTVNAYDNAWAHGSCGDVVFKDCHVPAGNLLKSDAAAMLIDQDAPDSAIPLAQAINIGIGRAAYEAARDYAHLRVQGGRPIIEHQAVATKLADIAIRLAVARAVIWQAAWASDHPEAVADGSLPDLPLSAVAQVFTSEAMLKATKDAAEMFGAMGVMRDMPLAKYIHDARICLHSGNGNSDAKLRIAEVIAGYRRLPQGALPRAGE